MNSNEKGQPGGPRGPRRRDAGELTVPAVEKLNVWAAMAQAEHDAGPSKTPVVAHTRNRSGWLVTMRAADWLTLIRASDLALVAALPTSASQISDPEFSDSLPPSHTSHPSPSSHSALEEHAA